MNFTAPAAGLLLAAALLASCQNEAPVSGTDTAADTTEQVTETQELPIGIDAYYSEELGKELGLEGYVCHINSLTERHKQ